jgi:parvulin-like peptidyl-prolyl isomerase
VRASALLAAVLAAAAVSSTCAGVVERIAVRVNRDVVTLTEWEDAVRAAAEARSGALSAEARRALEAEVLDRIVSERLILQAAADDGLKVTDAEIEDRVAAEIEALRGKFPNDQAFRDQMRREGVTDAELRRRIADQLKEQYLYMKMMARKQRELAAGLEVSAADIEAYYRAHRDDPAWRTEPRVRARHLLLAVPADAKGADRQRALAEARKRAKAALAALKRGEAFADVARTLSDDGATKESGGDLGVFAAGTYHPALETLAFSLKPGTTGGPVESPAGLHLVQVEEVFPARPKRLDEEIEVPPPPGAPAETTASRVVLKDHIAGVLRGRRLADAIQTWVNSLKAKAVIERRVESLSGT